MKLLKDNQTIPSRIRFPVKSDFSYYSDQRYSRLPKDKEKTDNHKKITLLILLLTMLAIFFFWMKSNLSLFWENLIKPYSFELFLSAQKPVKVYKNREEVLQEINKLLKDKTGNYAFYVYSFAKDEEYGIKEDKTYCAASINKVPIMLAWYKEIEKGNFSFDDEYQLKPEDIQDYGSGSMRYDEPGKTYTYKELASLAGKKSDNTAAYVMTKILGKKNIQKFIQALGLNTTSIEENLTTPKEAGQLFVKTYNKEILKDKDNLKIFFSNLTKTDYEDRISKGIPENIMVAHKIGNEERIYHDCGIVFGENPYVICIFSEEAPEDEALRVIPEISKIIWDYEN
jgi:beta-lactamase class A